MGRTGVRNSIAGCVFVRPSRNDAVSVTQPYAPLVTGPSSVRVFDSPRDSKAGAGMQKRVYIPDREGVLPRPQPAKSRPSRHLT